MRREDVFTEEEKERIEEVNRIGNMSSWLERNKDRIWKKYRGVDLIAAAGEGDDWEIVAHGDSYEDVKYKLADKGIEDAVMSAPPDPSLPVKLKYMFRLNKVIGE